MRKIGKRLGLMMLFLIGAASLWAQDSTATEKPKKEREQKIVTGFSGGMQLHIGYAFAQSPDALFRNASLKDVSNVTDLPSDGVTLGLGGALRLHLIDHIHLGIEGAVSTMPLMKSGSNIRTGWGDAFCDFFFPLGVIRPLVGLGVGGGTSKRLYVPSNAETVPSGSQTVYNASYTTTPFFLLDPYIGLEFKLGGHSALLIRVDYMLPFGSDGSVLSKKDVSWSNFITPSGPRLYVGVMFGKQ